MSDMPEKIYAYIHHEAESNDYGGWIDEYQPEDPDELYLNAEKLRERLVGMRRDNKTYDDWEDGIKYGVNGTIDEILSMMDDMIDEQKEDE